MSDDVLITPASRKIEFKDNSGNVDGKIELDSNGNLNITSPGGDIGIGDTTADVFIGDGTNNVDIVFEQNGEIRGLTGRTLTLGQADSAVAIASQNFTTTTDLHLNNADIVFEGSSADANETTITVTNPTADRTITLPNATGQVVLSGGAIDTDSSAEIGRAHIGYVGFGDYAGFSHVDANSTTNYALLHHPSGYTYLNAASGADIFFRINNSNIMQMDETGLHLEKALIENAYECTGTALDPSNGTLQYKTLSGNTTFTESFSDGESITLMIDDGSGYTVTWPTMTWASGSAPTLATSGYTTVVLWHRGGLYGAVVS